jgi:hypothetical protein
MKSAQKRKRARVNDAHFLGSTEASPRPQLALARLCANGLDRAARDARERGFEWLAVGLESAASRAFDELNRHMTQYPSSWRPKEPAER